MVIGVAVLGGVVLTVLFLLGSSLEGGLFSAGIPYGTDSKETCKEYCDQWRALSTARWYAEGHARDARAHADALWQTYWALAATAAGLYAAAVVASYIVFGGWVAAAALFGASAIASAAAVLWLGRAVGASSTADASDATAASARTAELQAQTRMIDNCSPDAVAACRVTLPQG